MTLGDSLIRGVVTFLQVSLAVFATYVLSSDDNYLTPDKAFVTLNLIQILNWGMSILPIFIAFGAQVSFTLA